MRIQKNTNSNTVTIILAIGIIICFLATIGYNVYVSYTKEKIEVRTMNSNFLKQNNLIE